MNPINVLTKTGKIKKTGTLATAFHKQSGEENPYAQFVYNPLKNFIHTRGQVSRSMDAYPINMIHKSHQSTKEDLVR